MVLAALICLLLGCKPTANAANAACTSNLVIDNFSKWSSNTNSLGYWTSDDGSMKAASANGGSLLFTPKGGSYFYETLSCVKTQADGYDAVSFTINGPKDSSLVLEIQTKRTCTTAAYSSNWFTVTSLTGSTQTLTVPLSSFSGARLDAVSAFVWSTFSVLDVPWQIGNIQFVCSAAPAQSLPSALPTSSSSATSASSIRTSTGVSSSRTSASSISTATSLASSRASTVRSSVGVSSSRTLSSSISTSTSLSSSRVSTVRTSTSVSRSLTLSSSISTSISLSSFRASSTTAISKSSTSSMPPTSSSVCKSLLVDDWESQSRLTFLNYNSMLEPTSDDGTMQSVVVNTHRVTLTPVNTDSYFYTQTGCVNSQIEYGGISMRIKAPAGTQFGIQLASPATCGGPETQFAYQTTTELGWTFDGTERLYSIPFLKFSSIDRSKVSTIFFGSFNQAVTLGPISFYCGSTPSEYLVPSVSQSSGPTSTVVAPSGTASPLVIDQFASEGVNALGFWHGGDDGMTLTWGDRKLTIKSSDPDYSFYTQVSGTCRDLTSFDKSYLHIAYSGSNKFSIALQQHNSICSQDVAPYPETWDSLEAARYASTSDIYIPISHFNIERRRVIGLALKGFYTNEAVTLTKVEIVPSVPAGFPIPNKLPSGNLVFACKRPNSFAFAIDDGDPKFAKEVMDIIKSEEIKVTFFTVGAPLQDPSTNLSNIYRDMLSQGHQIALHSYTHPKMEGLANNEAIDWEYNQDISAVSETFNGLHTPYFRPPFGNEGARMRQRLAVTTNTDNPYIVNWSVDVEDWLWAESSTPEKQLEAFNRDLAKGGNLVVMHYLYPSTVGYLRQFIQLAKATGKQLMRVDQCMMDPTAPPL